MDIEEALVIPYWCENAREKLDYVDHRGAAACAATVQLVTDYGSYMEQ